MATNKAVVTAEPKPALIDALRKTWRKSAQHAFEQISRFLRLTLLASVPVLLDALKGGKFDWRVLLAYIVPVAEVAWRQVFPALGATGVNYAPGVTIVPNQLDTPGDDGEVGHTTLTTLILVVVVGILGFILGLLANAAH